MNKFFEFFQGQEGENSAKRLIGIIAGLVFCWLAMAGALSFLEKGQSKEFQDLLETVGYFSGTLLGFGIVDIFFKKKYDSKPPSDVGS